MKRMPERPAPPRGLAGWTTIVLLLIVTVARAATASVITNASVTQNLTNASADVGYNDPLPGTPGVGYVSSGGCSPNNPGPPAITCGLMASGTTDTTGKLNASFDSLSMTGSIGPQPLIGVPAASATATAYAAASLATGSVGVAASGTYLDYRVPSSGQAGGTSSSFAQINDTLHFNIANVSPTTVTDIPISFTVRGLMTINTAAGDSGGLIRAILQLGNGYLEDDLNSGSTTYTPTLLAPTSALNWVSFSVTPTGPVPAPGLFTMTGVYAVTGSHADLGVAGTLSAQCGYGTSCEYSNTGIISFNLPGNVTYTSDSGVFLTGASAPEPGSIVLAAIGLAGLLLRRRK
jgi:hypothetical protein